MPWVRIATALLFRLKVAAGADLQKTLVVGAKKPNRRPKIAACALDRFPFLYWSRQSWPSRSPSAAGASAEGQGTAFGAGTFSAGGTHSCAIRGDGALACWGDDSKGQLDGIPAGTFTAVSAGGAQHLRDPGRRPLVCWGDDAKGQLTGSAGTFTAVSAGGAHTCAIRVGGTLVCWGDDSKGQDAVRGGEFTSVSAGGTHSCAIRENGHLACWGDNTAGQVSRGPGEWHIWHWYWHGAGSDFLAAAAGGAHSCCDQGRRHAGLLGRRLGGPSSTGSRQDVHRRHGGRRPYVCDRGRGRLSRMLGRRLEGPARRDPGGTFNAVSAGGAHTCAAPATGRLACWGDNSYGQSRPRIVSPDPSEATVGEPYSHQFETTAQNPGRSSRSSPVSFPTGWRWRRTDCSLAALDRGQLHLHGGGEQRHHRRRGAGGDAPGDRSAAAAAAAAGRAPGSRGALGAATAGRRAERQPRPGRRGRQNEMPGQRGLLDDRGRGADLRSAAPSTPATAPSI